MAPDFLSEFSLDKDGGICYQGKRYKVCYQNRSREWAGLGGPARIPVLVTERQEKRNKFRDKFGALSIIIQVVGGALIGYAFGRSELGFIYFWGIFYGLLFLIPALVDRFWLREKPLFSGAEVQLILKSLGVDVII